MSVMNSTSVVQIAIACILSTILFTTLIIYISKHPHKRTLPLKITFIIMFLGGVVLYCICHYQALMQFLGKKTSDKYLDWVKSPKNSWYYTIPYVIMRAVIDVGMMFYGRVNTDVFYDLPEAKEPLFVLLFWMIHIVAVYTTASALLIRFGNDLLRWIRIMTSKISDVNIIFGVNSESLTFGRNIADRKGEMLVYVDSVISENFDGVILDMGGLTYSYKEAVKASPKFLRILRIKPGTTKLRLYALSDEYDRNLQYAQMMLESLKSMNILPDQTSLMLLGTDELKGMVFQAKTEQYGYGSVVSFDENEVSARILIHEYPPCNAINFGEDGRAIEDMNVLIVGFGRIGHEVLRKVIANAQFEGSDFHATVYEPNLDNIAGFFRSQYQTMFANYDIGFEPYGGRCSSIFQFLNDNASKLKYIVICIEDKDVARDIAVHMADRLQAMGYSQNVYTCDTKSIRCYSPNMQDCATHWIYDSEILYSGELDKYAVELNHRYTGGASAAEDWRQCKYFDRMSSRASVDYLIPLIRRLTHNKTAELTPVQKENLAKSEHMRWCAFHYTFGFDVMDKEEFIRRVKARQDEIRKYGSSNIRPTKDTKQQLHVCLVDWDELDEVSRIENSITSGNRNYKDSDRGNVQTVMDIMQEEDSKN